MNSLEQELQEGIDNNENLEYNTKIDDDGFPLNEDSSLEPTEESKEENVKNSEEIEQEKEDPELEKAVKTGFDPSRGNKTPKEWNLTGELIAANRLNKELSKKFDHLIKENNAFKAFLFDEKIDNLKNLKERYDQIALTSEDPEDVRAAHKEASKIEEKVAKIEQEKISSNNQNNPQPVISDEVKSFMTKHSKWFNPKTPLDRAINSYLLSRDIELIETNPNSTETERLDLLEKEVVQKFLPSHKTMVPSPTKLSTKSSHGDLNVNNLSEAHKKLYKQFVVEQKIFTKEEFFKDCVEPWKRKNI